MSIVSSVVPIALVRYQRNKSKKEKGKTPNVHTNAHTNAWVLMEQNDVILHLDDQYTYRMLFRRSMQASLAPTASRISVGLPAWSSSMTQLPVLRTKQSLNNSAPSQL